MDSEHRHELQQNDLEQELLAIGTWIKTNGSKLFFYIALTALIVVGVYKFRQMRDGDQTAVLTAYADCSGAQFAPDDESIRLLTELTAQTTNERIAVQCQLLLGQVRMVQAGNADTPEKTTALRVQATTHLKSLLSNSAADYPVLAAKAQIALMTIAMDEGDFDNAKSLLAAVKDKKLPGNPMANEIAESEALLKALAAKPVTLAKPAAWLPKPVVPVAPVMPDAPKAPAGTDVLDALETTTTTTPAPAPVKTPAPAPAATAPAK